VTLCSHGAENADRQEAGLETNKKGQRMLNVLETNERMNGFAKSPPSLAYVSKYAHAAADLVFRKEAV